MSYIVYGRVDNEFIRSYPNCADIFGYDLDQNGVVKLMVEALDRSCKLDGEFKFLVFEDGKLYTADITRNLTKEALKQARTMAEERNKRIEEELKQKAAEATKRQEVLDRQHYEVLHKRFGGEAK